LVGSEAQKSLWSNFQAEASPSCRILPTSAHDVAAALQVIRSNSCQFAVLGGGTSPFKGASNAIGGVTLDMSLLNSIDIQQDALATDLSIQVGAGCRWADVYGALDARNLSATGTRNSLTGVVGSILGGTALFTCFFNFTLTCENAGGISFFSQHHGWSCDTVSAFEIVLANSSIVEVTESSQPDLFWALRGGGNNLGIVTKVTIDVFPDPPTWYTFQRWRMSALTTVFERLEKHTAKFPKEVSQIAVTLQWHVALQEFVLSERMVASSLPELPETTLEGTKSHNSTPVLETYYYQESVLQMSQKMDKMNPYGYYNFFGTATVKSSSAVFTAIAHIFEEEAATVASVPGLQLYIVYNPLTLEAIAKMQNRGGNALGISIEDGPLTSKLPSCRGERSANNRLVVNINMHWSEEVDGDRMRAVMRRLITRFHKAAHDTNSHHPYLFQNHAFEEQRVFEGYGKENLNRLIEVRRNVDPDRVMQVLQPGYFKLEEPPRVFDIKSEL
jgi:FAD/FMN-containing dehydrogenase